LDDIGLYEAMSTCRAVRRLLPDPVPDAVLERLIRAATWAPTGANAQPWRIVVVRDRARMRKLGELYRAVWAPYSERTRARIAALPEERRGRHERTVGAGDYLAEHFDQTPVSLVWCFDPSLLAITDEKLDRPSVVGGGSLYTAVQNLLLACRAEGLGCVLTTLLCVREAEVRELLEIPDPWGTFAVVPIGHPLRRGHGPLSRRNVAEMAFDDRWGVPLFEPVA
jgi:nitroreductase